MKTIDYVGTRWYKCDFHLHTPASECFEETTTAEAWVKAAKDKGLDCVAVTDHNCADWIDTIKDEAAKVGLTVFPGIELTCDTSKIHLLVLFDLHFGTEEVKAFAAACGIKPKSVSEKEKSTTLQIFEVLEKAN